MSTDTVYVCPNENCSNTTEYKQPKNCPNCGTKTEAQPDDELEK